MTPNVSFNDLSQVASFTSKTNEVLNTQNFSQETEITIDGFSELAQTALLEADTSNLSNNERLEETLQKKRKMLLKRLADEHVKNSFKYFGPLSDDAYVQILY